VRKVFLGSLPMPHTPFRFHQLFYRNAILVHLCTWMAGQKAGQKGRHVKLDGWLKERWIDDRHRHMSNKPWKYF
jgi:hypothetical protein